MEYSDKGAVDLISQLNKRFVSGNAIPVERASIKTTEWVALRAHVEGLEKALRDIAAPTECGCSPCRGDCRSQEALQIHIDAIQDIARAALEQATKPESHDALEGIANLTDNWDSYGARPIDPRCVAKARELMRVLPGWKPIPTSGGGMQLEHYADGFELELNIALAQAKEGSVTRDGSFSYCHRCGDTRLVEHNKLTGHVIACPACSQAKEGA